MVMQNLPLMQQLMHVCGIRVVAPSIRVPVGDVVRMCLQELEERNSYPEPKCKQANEFVETNQVNLKSLLGLWYILGAFLVVASVAGAAPFLSCTLLKS
jgi:hypothetical protein